MAGGFKVNPQPLNPEPVNGYKELDLYLCKGAQWAHACGSYNSGGVVQSGGEWGLFQVSSSPVGTLVIRFLAVDIWISDGIGRSFEYPLFLLPWFYCPRNVAGLR